MHYLGIGVVLCPALEENKEIRQLDIVTAFLESYIEEELYLRLRRHFGMTKEGGSDL